MQTKILLAVAAAALAGAAPVPADQTHYYAIVADGGAWIGHESSEVREGPDGRHRIESRELRLQDEETGSGEIRILDRSETLFGPDGRPRSLLALARTGDRWTRTEVTIDGDRAQVVRRTLEGRRSFSLTLPPGTRFDSGEGLLAGWNPAARPSLQYFEFDPSSEAVERVVIETLPSAPDQPPGTIAARRLRYEGPALLSISTLVVSADGQILSMTQPLFGTGVTTRPTGREEALRERPAYPALRSAMVKSPFRIPAAARNGHIRYRFGFRDGLAFPLPDTGEQHPSVDGDGAVLDICADCGPGLPTDAAYLADALKPTAWLEADDPRIRGLAAPAARQHISGARKMMLLQSIAQPYLARIDFVGHYTAVETLKRRAGDCTEAAALLAALGRAAGIPTRVASGIVYSREQYHGVADVFMPHSWVLAYVDGRWRSFDLALDFFDSTHIALTVGDGDERSIAAAGQLAALLQWRGMAEIRTRSGG
ncbi:MAG TPA: transglutaminase domain-containing protein [Allosphingosinicella sp.]|nr:transglutaminase domain-containing protein [Allosphingosinicella sp.]